MKLLFKGLTNMVKDATLPSATLEGGIGGTGIGLPFEFIFLYPLYAASIGLIQDQSFCI